MPELKGRVMTLLFEIEGMQILALNGGPQFRFTEAISLAVNCETQAEVDRLWDALTAGGGEPGHCGWLKDRFGVSWQVLPRRLIDMLKDPDAARATRAMQAMMTMRRLDIAEVERAFAG